MKRYKDVRLTIRVTPELYHQIERVAGEEKVRGKSFSISHAARVLLGHGVHRYSERVRQKKS